MNGRGLGLVDLQRGDVIAGRVGLCLALECHDLATWLRWNRKTREQASMMTRRAPKVALVVTLAVTVCGVTLWLHLRG